MGMPSSSDVATRIPGKISSRITMTHVNIPAQTMLDLLVLRHEEQGSAPAILAPGREAISYAALCAGIDRAGDALAALASVAATGSRLRFRDGPDAAAVMLATMVWATCAPLNPRVDEVACAALFAQLRIDALIVEADDEGPAVAAARAAGLLVVRLAAAVRDRGDLFALRRRVEAGAGGAEPAATGRRCAGDAHLRHDRQAQGRADHASSAALDRDATSDRRRATVACASRRCSRSAASAGGVISPLAVGASTVITPGFDAARFFEWLDTFRPTYYSASPTVHAAIIDEFVRRRPELPTSLRFVRSSSSSMSAVAAGEAGSRYWGCR